MTSEMLGNHSTPGPTVRRKEVPGDATDWGVAPDNLWSYPVIWTPTGSQDWGRGEIRAPHQFFG
jgi:hypothetical protein